MTTIIIGAAGLLSVGGYGMVRMVNFLNPNSANAILSVAMLLVASFDNFDILFYQQWR